jgi:4-methyl-5(b-hydroxyethyl)-thiazole monophosphate biosynthesis
MKSVLLLLAKGFETFEASVFIDVIGWNHTYGNCDTKLYTCGIENHIKSSFNVEVITDEIIDNINPDDYDALAIPGGFEEYGFYEDAFDEKFIRLIREFHKRNKIIASICVGALPLGKSGILKGKRGTTYNLSNGFRQNQLKAYGVEVVNEPIVIDGNIITSWNPSTAIDVSLKLLELLTSKENSDSIKKLMGF